MRSCLNYVGVTASATGTVNTTITQINNVGVNGSYLFYPAVSVDSAGNVFTTFDESSSTTFPTIIERDDRVGRIDPERVPDGAYEHELLQPRLCVPADRLDECVPLG